MNTPEHFMKLAIQIAETSRTKSSPNPHVGAIVVNNDRVISQGSTQKFGGDHAEIVALKQAGKNAEGADLYVTLEPCCHYGKTPPCTDAIIASGIKRVFAGLSDPNPLVDGKGFQILRDHGIEVHTGILRCEIEKQLEVFIYWKQNKIPYIVMKNAVTLDGRIASNTGDSKWITGENSRKRVHLLRSQYDAVLTGINTVIADDPLFNVRYFEDSRFPIRIILDPFLKIPLTSKIAQTANLYKTIIFKSTNYIDPQKEEQLFEKDMTVISVPSDEEKLDLIEILAKLSDFPISSVMVEAGKTLNTSFLRNQLVQKIYYFIAPKIIGGNNSVYNDLNIDLMSECIKIVNKTVEFIDDDLLVTGYVLYNR